MEATRVTSKGQMTIPKAIRERLRIKTGDVLGCSIEGDRVVLRKLTAADAAYLRGIERTLDEWASAADDEAYRDL